MNIAKAQTYEELIAKGADLFSKKSYAEALTMFDKAIDLKPSEPTAYFNRAVIYGLLKEFERCDHELQKTLEVDSTYLRAYYTMATNYYSQGRFTEAISALDKLINRNSSYEGALQLRGLIKILNLNNKTGGCHDIFLAIDNLQADATELAQKYCFKEFLYLPWFDFFIKAESAAENSGQTNFFLEDQTGESNKFSGSTLSLSNESVSPEMIMSFLEKEAKATDQRIVETVILEQVKSSENPYLFFRISSRSKQNPEQGYSQFWYVVQGTAVFRIACVTLNKPTVNTQEENQFTSFFKNGKMLPGQYWKVPYQRAMNLGNEGKAELALPSMETAYLLALEQIGKKHPEFAVIASNLSLLYSELGQPYHAIAFSREAIELFNQHGNHSKADLAILHYNLGGSYRESRAFDSAIYHYKKAKTLLEEAGENKTLTYEYVLASLGDSYTNKHQFSEAESTFLSLLAGQENRVGKFHLDYMRSVQRLLNVYILSNTEDKIVTFLLPYLKSLGEANNQEVATLYYYLGRAFAHTGQYANALLAYQDSQVKFEKIGLELSDTYHSLMTSYSNELLEFGNYGLAVKILAAYLAKIEAAEGKTEKFGEVATYLGLGYLRAGDHSRAEVYLTESINTLADTPNSDYYGVAQNNLALLYKQTGNFEKAEALYLESIKAIEQKQGKNNLQYMAVLNNIAKLYVDMKKEGLAEKYYNDAATIGLALPPQPLVVKKFAELLKNYAQLLQTKLEYQAAEETFKMAISYFEKNVGKLNDTYATMLNDLAFLYAEMGQFKKAEPYYLESLNISKQIHSTNHPNHTDLLLNVARLYDDQFDFKKAKPYYKQAVASKIQEIIEYFPMLSESEKESYYEKNLFFIEEFQAFAIHEGLQDREILSQLLDLRLIFKSMLLNTGIKTRNYIANSNDQELKHLYDRWRQKRELLSQLYRMPAEDQLQQGFSMDGTRDEIDKIEKILSQKIPKTVWEQRQSWQDVRNSLMPDEAAVEIVRSVGFRKSQLIATAGDKDILNTFLKVDTALYAAIIIRPGNNTNLDMVILANGQELENELADAYQVSLRQVPSPAQKTSGHQERGATVEVIKTAKQRDVYGSYWRPIVEKVMGAHKVFLSTDGIYNQINVNTLYNTTTEKYVIDELDVHLVTSLREVIDHGTPRKLLPSRAVLFGYPDYNHKVISGKNGAPANTPKLTLQPDSTLRFLDGQKIQELPGTKVEVENATILLKSHGIEAIAYLHKNATEAQLKKETNFQLLHIATHGFFLSNLDSKTTPKNNQTNYFQRNPLLRSGLLLAGSAEAFTNSERSNQQEDGVLTAFEARNLNLDETALVILSACETGLGVNKSGEGVYGLQRSLLMAGAQSILMSLWKVSDEGTQRLIRAFYEDWFKSGLIRDSFRRVQIQLRDEYPEPYIWGAFVLVGN